MTEDIRRLRGDWLIEALTAIARGQGRWTPIPTKPLGMNHGAPGRFHQPTQTYWPEAREDSAADPPMVRYVRIPGETALNYPGERVTITPTWVRHVHAQFAKARCYDTFVDYARSDNAYSIAYYLPRERRVVWSGNHPNLMRTAALIASDAMEYTPVNDNPLVKTDTVCV